MDQLNMNNIKYHEKINTHTQRTKNNTIQRSGFLLNKNIKFNKNETKSKMENSTHSFREMNHDSTRIRIAN